jgi:hypothetical protein
MPRRMASTLDGGRAAIGVAQKSAVDRLDLRDTGDESDLSPVSFLGSGTLPAAEARRTLLVRTTHTAVAIVVRFEASPERPRRSAHRRGQEVYSFLA